MSKKNTIFIAILGLLTLITTVIGASFAYFKIQTNADLETTSVKNKSASSGSVIFSTITNSLHFKVNDAEMSIENIGAKYYATTDVNKDYVRENEPHVYTLAEAKVTGGEKVFKCYYNFTVSLNEGTDMNPATKGEVVLTFSGDSKISDNQTIDIKDLIDGKKLKFKGHFENLTYSGGSQKINMEMYVKNTNAEQAPYIANKFLSLKIEPTSDTPSFYCDGIPNS